MLLDLMEIMPPPPPPPELLYDALEELALYEDEADDAILDARECVCGCAQSQFSRTLLYIFTVYFVPPRRS